MKNEIFWLPALALTAGLLCTAALGAGPAGRTGAAGSPSANVGSAGPGMAVGGGVRSSSGAVSGGNGISGYNPAPTVSGAIPGNPAPGVNGVVSGPGTVVNGSIVTPPTNGTTPNQAALQGTAVSQQQVMDAQRALSASGYSVTLDGISGPQTQNAIRSFQATHGLPATGELDSNTMNLMNNGNSGVTNQNSATETPSNL